MIRPKILLVEDLLFIVTLMTELLKQYYDVTVADSVESARAALEVERFDLALLDLKLGEHGCGLEVLPEILSRGARVMVISAHCTPAWGLACLRGNVSCFMDKHKTGSELLDKIELVLAGRQDFPAEWLAKLGDGKPLSLPPMGLTQRKVLSLLVNNNDLTNLAISEILGKKDETVKKAMSELIQKFAAKHRFDLVKRAKERGFLPIRVEAA